MNRLGVDSSPHAGLQCPFFDQVNRPPEHLRDLALDLRPSVLDDLGLAAAIRWYADRFARTGRIDAHLSIDVLPALEAELETACFRVAQEALTNVARHSNASRVEVRVRERAGELLLEIRDDGRGIVSEQVSAPSSLGLTSIRERAGMLGGTAVIEGVPGRGTIVSVRIPLGKQTGREA